MEEKGARVFCMHTEQVKRSHFAFSFKKINKQKDKSCCTSLKVVVLLASGKPRAEVIVRQYQYGRILCKFLGKKKKQKSYQPPKIILIFSTVPLFPFTQNERNKTIFASIQFSNEP